MGYQRRVHGECGTEATADNMKLLVAVSLALLGMAVDEPGYGYYGLGYGHGYGYGHHGYYGKRSADAEPTAAAEPGYGYGGYGHHGYYGKRSADAEPGYGYYGHGYGHG